MQQNLLLQSSGPARTYNLVMLHDQAGGGGQSANGGKQSKTPSCGITTHTALPCRTKVSQLPTTGPLQLRQNIWEDGDSPAVLSHSWPFPSTCLPPWTKCAIARPHPRPSESHDASSPQCSKQDNAQANRLQALIHSCPHYPLIKPTAPHTQRKPAQLPRRH